MPAGPALITDLVIPTIAEGQHGAHLNEVLLPQKHAQPDGGLWAGREAPQRGQLHGSHAAAARLDGDGRGEGAAEGMRGALDAPRLPAGGQGWQLQADDGQVAPPCRQQQLDCFPQQAVYTIAENEDPCVRWCWFAVQCGWQPGRQHCKLQGCMMIGVACYERSSR
jgi:hypothetical protein